MLRRFAATLAVVLAFALLGFLWIEQVAPPALTLTVGSGPIALVQNGPLVIGGLKGVSPTLTTASTPGTALVAVLIGDVVTAAPAGWVQIQTVTVAAGLTYQVWVYLNNPGGILTANFTVQVVASTTDAHISEWANVVSASALETSGTATAIAGTTLTPGTSAAIANPGDLVIAGWGQALAGAGVVTFTTPSGFTRLKDNGASNVQGHDDLEYQINPPTGLALTLVLTSTGTTVLAAGGIIVLKAAAPAVSHAAYIKDSSLSLKLNTADWSEIDLWATVLDETGANILDETGANVLGETATPALGDPVTFTNPAWTGRITRLNKVDLREIRDYHWQLDLSATNSAVASATPIAPGDFSDNPTDGAILDENGAAVLDENGYDIFAENAQFAYRGLSAESAQNQDGSTTVYGHLRTYQWGYAAGQAVTLTNLNLGYSAAATTITNVTSGFYSPSGQGYYDVEFGDAYQTLQTAGGGVITRTASVASTQTGVVAGAGVLGYAEVTADQGTFTADTAITGLAVTVTVGSGRRIKITVETMASSSVATDLVRLQVRDAASNNIQTAYVNMDVLNQRETMKLEAIVKPTAGVQTYTVYMARSAGTGNITMKATAGEPSFILVEDIGT